MIYAFYEKARRLWMKTQQRQIVKGLEKYDEPFNPSHWTPAQLLDHALEESVDLVHYIVGMKEVAESLEKENETLRNQVNELTAHLEALTKQHM